MALRQPPRDVPAHLETLPDELLSIILDNAYPHVKIPASVAWHEEEDIKAELNHCVGLARLSCVSRRWCRLCDEAGDLFLRFDDKTSAIRRKMSRVRKVIVQIAADTPERFVDLPRWLAPVLAPAATLVVLTGRQDVFPHDAPIWATLQEVYFHEVHLALRWPRSKSPEPCPVRNFASLQVRHFRCDFLPTSFNHFVNTRNLETLQLPLSDLDQVMRFHFDALTALHIVSGYWLLGIGMQTWPAAARLRYLSWETVDPVGFNQVWGATRDLERVSLSRYTLDPDSLAHLPSLHKLSFVRLVRPAEAPAAGWHPYFWTFDSLAEQVARLLAQPERAAVPLRIEVVVEGTLRKYDVAQRKARECFRAAMSELAPAQNSGLEVWLYFYPGRPYRAFPLPSQA